MGVASEHDLVSPVAKRVEGVEEFLLRLGLVAQEVDVVDDEDLGGTVPLPEAGDRPRSEARHELVEELLARQVSHLEVRSPDP
jgi:hypothetical protein